MKKSILLIFLAVGAQASESQSIFMESTIWRSIPTCLEAVEEAQERIEKQAQSKCSGELTRISDWISVLQKPIHSFCYPKVVSAVFECVK